MTPATVGEFVRATSGHYVPQVETPDIDVLVLRALGLPDNYCGSIQFNYFKGGASTVNVGWSEKLR